MREIKFRAWDSARKEMCNKPQMDYTDDIDGHGFHNAYFEDERNFKDLPIVMQYIGKKDMDGKEVYEGDIVAYEGIKVNIGKIVYSEKWGCYEIKMIIGGETLEITDLHYSAVIGNIYENKELLEE